MKEKVMKIINDFKSSISLFIIMFAVTLLMAIICRIFGASDITRVVFSASFGILTLLGLEYLEEFIGMRLGDNKRPAYVGIIIGVLIALL